MANNVDVGYSPLFIMLVSLVFAIRFTHFGLSYF